MRKTSLICILFRISILQAFAQTGTVGQIPKYSSSSTFTNSIINELDGNIGIGVSVPTSKLHLSLPSQISIGTPNVNNTEGCAQGKRIKILSLSPSVYYY
jgi:hypothetical protein